MMTMLNRLSRKVHHVSVKPWRFDVARNASLALVPADADVCLTLDMDELINDDFIDKIREVWIPGVLWTSCE